LAGNAWGQKVSGENEYFKFTVEFKDSVFVSVYGDSIDLVKKQIEDNLFLTFAELMCPKKFRWEANDEVFMPTYTKLCKLRSLVENVSDKDTTITESTREKLRIAHNVMVKYWDDRYANRQWDVIAPIYNKRK